MATFLGGGSKLQNYPKNDYMIYCLKEEMSRHNGYENWNAKFHTDSYTTGQNGNFCFCVS